MKRTRLFSSLIAASLVSGAAAETLIPINAVWKYLDDGSDQGTNWTAIAFDDSSWTNGPAELGYGDGDEATVLGYGGVATNKFVTYYFRKTFTVTDPAAFVALNAQLLRDDGAIVYINGHEFLRSNMPVGPVDYLTFAAGSAGTDENILFAFGPVVTNVLVAGSNVVAAEIHQRTLASSDIGFNFSLTGLTNLPPVTVTRGPYLQLGTPTNMVVRWRTSADTNSRVLYGPSIDSMTSVVASAAYTSEHELVLSGLQPTTTYFYAVGGGTTVLAGGDSNHMFRTSVPAGVREPVRIWALGDSGTADSNARAVRDAYYDWSERIPDVWLMLGDNAYNSGTDEEYQAAVFEMYTNALRRTPLWPTLGNHDGYTANSAAQNGPYYDSFTLPRLGEAGGLASGTEAYYSFDYANVHFVCLESYETDRTTNGAMYVWTVNDVAATTQDWVIAFWHHPPYTKGSHDSDIESRHDDMRERFGAALEAAGVDLVLGGHSHSYERSFLLHGHYGVSATFDPSMQANGGSGRVGDPLGVYDKTLTNGAVYVVAGSSGKISGGPLNHPAMYVSLNNLGSFVIDVDGDTLDAHFIDHTGSALDWFTMRKNSDTFTLETLVSGLGSIDPPTSLFLSNATVLVSAAPSNFFSFAGWTGDVSGVSNPVPVVMSGDRSVTAVFDPIPEVAAVTMSWLALHGLPTNLASVIDDQDGDGYFTFEEFITDTIPTVSSSHLRVDSVIYSTGSPARASISFQTSSSRVYRVERSATGMMNPAWESITNGLMGVGTIMSIEDDPDAPSQAYRIKARLP